MDAGWPTMPNRAAVRLLLVGPLALCCAAGTGVHQETLLRKFADTADAPGWSPESPLQALSRHVATTLGMDPSDEALHARVAATFLDAAGPIFLEVAASTAAAAQMHTASTALLSAGASAPFDPSSGLSEPTAACRQLLSDWMAKCVFGPRPV